jgi:hypothetical protein
MTVNTRPTRPISAFRKRLSGLRGAVAGGGLTCFVKDGIIYYEYNLFIVQRTKIRATRPLPAGALF